ncbi:hypothetical protein GDO78_012101 [Eleutherodactylus coqui]|uniref:Uncharacterized protein n=1 Tax=Eleutherodactylus coqui TaxID=57060 RepID=A0A8J6F1Z1_ELECQ|nr:hypothetical protein GDO78_012101 [Eleutherodactylus coqui]
MNPIRLNGVIQCFFFPAMRCGKPIAAHPIYGHTIALHRPLFPMGPAAASHHVRGARNAMQGLPIANTHWQAQYWPSFSG